MSVADVALSPVREVPGYLGTCLDDESIEIFLTVAGSVIPMRVLESDSIASVKLRIQTCKGYIAKKQKLVFGGRELARNNSLLKEYGVTEGNILHLVLCFSDLLVIVVRTARGEEFEFEVDQYENVGYLKKQIAKKGHNLADLEDQELLLDGEKLYDQRRIVDICKTTDVIHLVVQKSAKIQAEHVEKDVELSVEAANCYEKTDGQNLQVLSGKPPFTNFGLKPMFVNSDVKLPSLIWDMIKDTLEGLKIGKIPIRSSEGTGGTYFMQNTFKHEYVSVFKPIDEEPLAVNNPQGLPLSENGEGLKRGTRVGEGALREVAAYILDHPKNGSRSLMSNEIGFAGVPPTVMVRCLHRGFNHPEGYEGGLENVKIGSLQMFVKNNGSCEDMGHRDFPVEEVHKISVLDVRMANADRHAGNILVSKEGENRGIKLIPIDHGYCLPENFEDCTFDWLYWPQARQPYSPDTIEYINSLDPEKDIALLKFYGWNLSLECARTFRISTMLLKKGAKKGLTPFNIGSIMCRETLNKESVIEKIVQEAQDLILPGASEQAFLESVSEIMDFHLDNVAK